LQVVSILCLEVVVYGGDLLSNIFLGPFRHGFTAKFIGDEDQDAVCRHVDDKEEHESTSADKERNAFTSVEPHGGDYLSKATAVSTSASIMPSLRVRLSPSISAPFRFTIHG